MNFGEKIKSARTEAALTQEQLGIKCGWTTGNPQSRIGNYEKDVRNPSASDIAVIAKALNKNILFFYGQEALTHASAEESQPSYESRNKLSAAQIELLREVILQTEKISLEEGLKLNAEQRAKMIAAGFAAYTAENLTAKDISNSREAALASLYTAI
ncbi:helix-turn-helix transcriptional regulator [Neptuniibacter sp. UBA847]|uniref:helix-turn-helix domain-containing protein n=1 Tax=Neptuniibacter sp. UBA847 TaxID=1946977 RepID=UPI000C56A1E9|nr:helix-turn-helix transcriptional regulator [Neptuniibacter sp. UBA847]MAY42406.1 hypothetical protein [Oceanospirillaceae bacterium]|tara:strand:+ start:27583 stop:28053 length:471 start_codon:yes stop_codon:yes gene_type:complete